MAQDRSKWFLPGQNVSYGKCPFTQVIFKTYIEGKLTLAETKTLFSFFENLPSSIGNRTVFLERNQPHSPERFYGADPIKTKDGHYLVVSNQWSKINWPYFLRAVHNKFGFALKCCNLSKEGKAELTGLGLNPQEVNC
ncbi:hypothetical protein KB206_02120 [Microvirga sp. STS02]|uniref:hypothetical protein n=1 Tax=Hymenobacter negativus TaxID=2795026 RepID=UPI0018DD8396|nr:MULTISPECIES: hypothetical protein [Bacteria]MBH8567662.1 hypothetical protein [Hymenobacter negativus]MBR7207396.1 hypothetical protein [Microvirga sp. STS02]